MNLKSRRTLSQNHHRYVAGVSAFDYMSITVHQASFQSDVCQMCPKHTSKPMQLCITEEKEMTIF